MPRGTVKARTRRAGCDAARGFGPMPFPLGLHAAVRLGGSSGLNEGPFDAKDNHAAFESITVNLVCRTQVQTHL